jgi:hypothetical protein
MKIAFAPVLLIIILAANPCAAEDHKRGATQMAALALPIGGVRADWQQWDGFLTTTVKRLAQDLSPSLREQLGEAFLDTRYDLVQLLKSGQSDPVPQLFSDAWNRLSPIMKQSVPGLAKQSAGQFTSFITAMDGLKTLTDAGRQLGFFRITPEALRGAAQLLGTGGADPLAYDLNLDSTLRDLVGLSESLPNPNPSPLLEQSHWQRLREKASAAFKNFWLRSAHAQEDEFERLNQWVPEVPEVQDYLRVVEKLLIDTSGRVLAKSKLLPEHHELYRQIVFATAWQESCWRQFTKKGLKLAPIASSTGDVGLMQVNRTTWRSLYDVKGLNGDMSYNGYAGAEILHYYLTRYAIAKKEDQQKGGNLARATYSAYNAGPGGLGRYRGVRQSAVWKKVDEAFWTKFQAISSGQDLAVKTCYGQ